MRGILLFIGILAAGSLMAQEISKTEMDKIRSGFKKDAYTKAMQNALSSNDISKLAWNRENVGATDPFFTYRVDVSGLPIRKVQGAAGCFLR